VAPVQGRFLAPASDCLARTTCDSIASNPVRQEPRRRHTSRRALHAELGLRESVERRGRASDATTPADQPATYLDSAPCISSGSTSSLSCAGSARRPRGRHGTSLCPGASQAIGSCKRQSSSAAASGLTAGIGQRRRPDPQRRHGPNWWSQQSTAGRAAGARRLPLRLRDQPRRRHSTTLLVWTISMSLGQAASGPTRGFWSSSGPGLRHEAPYDRAG
jgi:hypothetical protein